MSSAAVEQPLSTMGSTDSQIQDLVNDDIAAVAQTDKIDVQEPDAPEANTPKKRNTKKTGKVKAADDKDDEATASTPKTAAGKKRGAAAAEGKTPVKKVKAATTPKAAATTKAKVTKAAAVPFPESSADFSDADRLLINMKKDGKGWVEINEAWEQQTGKPPGKDVLRKRLTKLQAVAQEFQPGDGARIATAKITVEEETAAVIRKLEVEKWAKIAVHVAANGSETYKAGVLEKKWANMQKNGEVDDKGKYIGTDIAPLNTNGAANNSFTAINANGQGSQDDVKESVEGNDEDMEEEE